LFFWGFGRGGYTAVKNVVVVIFLYYSILIGCMDAEWEFHKNKLILYGYTLLEQSLLHASTTNMHDLNFTFEVDSIPATFTFVLFELSAEYLEKTTDLSQVTDKLYHISCFNKNITNNLNIDSQFIWLLSNEDTDVCRSIAKYLNLCFLLRTKVWFFWLFYMSRYFLILLAYIQFVLKYIRVTPLETHYKLIL
jgi:hypothetical protein